VKHEEMAPLKSRHNENKFLSPKTDRVFEFQSKRVDFRRRPCSKNNQVVILYFDGVIGEIL
jgi:hypothetical protein